MRRGGAKPCHAARKRTTADRPKSARAEPARARREAPYPHPSESAGFRSEKESGPGGETGPLLKVRISCGGCGELPGGSLR